MSEWISVAERLPEARKVLVYGPELSWDSEFGIAVYTASGRWLSAIGKFRGPVTHWMALPEPPVNPAMLAIATVMSKELEPAPPTDEQRNAIAEWLRERLPEPPK